MRFKSFLLSESISKNQLKSFKDVLSTFANKEPDEQKRKSGFVVSITSIGSWPILVEKLKEYFAAHHYTLEDQDKKEFKASLESLKIWGTYEDGDAHFYLTTDNKVKEPEWEEVEEEKEEDK